MGIGEIFTAIFGTIGRYWRALLAIGGAAAVVVSAAMLPVHAWSYRLAGISPDTDPDRVLELFLDGVAWLPVLSLVAAITSVVVVGLTAPVVHAAVIGEPLAAGQAWRRARPQLGRLLLLAPVIAVATQVGFLLCFIPGLLLGLMWSFAAPVLVIERCGVLQALRRSWRLVAREFWRVLGITVLVGLAVGFVAGSVSQVTVLPGVLGGNGALTALELVLAAAGSLIGTAVTFPVVAANAGLLYLDTRIRHERYDIALARAASEAHPLR